MRISPKGGWSQEIWRSGWARVAVLCWLASLCWPLCVPLVAAGDDLSLLWTHYHAADVWAELSAEWHRPLFRPLALLACAWCDVESLEAPATVLLQAGLLLVLLVGTERVAQYMDKDAPPFGLVSTLVLLHPSTTLSVWQVDTLSQTGSAACGVWLVATALAEPGRWRWAQWVGLTALGLAWKETFLGYLLVAVLVNWFAHDRPRIRISKPALIGAGLGASYAFARLLVAGTLPSVTGDRYSLSLGMNALVNGVHLVTGLLSFGASHRLRLGPPTAPLTVLALLTLLLHIGLLAAALRRPRQRVLVLQFWGLAGLALLPVLPMGHVSELYLMGPNVCTALALCACLAPHLRATSLSSRQSSWKGRAFQLGFALALLGCTAGHISRAYHFGLTWHYSAELHRQARAVPREALLAASSTTEVVLPKTPDCAWPDAPAHSTYVMRPLQALNAKASARLLGMYNPAAPAHLVARLNCQALPQRRPF